MEREFLTSWLQSYLAAEHSQQRCCEDGPSTDRSSVLRGSTIEDSLPKLSPDQGFEFEEIISREDLAKRVLDPLFLQELFVLLSPAEFEADEFPDNGSMVSHLLQQLLSFFSRKEIDAQASLKHLKE